MGVVVESTCNAKSKKATQTWQQIFCISRHPSQMSEKMIFPMIALVNHSIAVTVTNLLRAHHLQGSELKPMAHLSGPHGQKQSPEECQLCKLSSEHVSFHLERDSGLVAAVHPLHQSQVKIWPFHHCWRLFFVHHYPTNGGVQAKKATSTILLEACR